MELSSERRPLLVGERMNVHGSRTFKGYIEARDYAGAAEVGVAQVRSGAQMLDVCLRQEGHDELADLEAVIHRLLRQVDVPLMIDSQDPSVAEQVLRRFKGSVAVLNSANLGQGRVRFEELASLARRFDVPLVVGLIDETGAAVGVARKLAVARRSFTILEKKLDVKPEKIWCDALVFPCSAVGEYLGSTLATLEGLRRLRDEFPQVRTLLGISNVSYGLPVLARPVLDSVFLHHATEAGLGVAIANVETHVDVATLGAKERQLAERLLFLKPGEMGKARKVLADCVAQWGDKG